MDLFWYVALLAALGVILLWRLFRCAHPWELVDKTELPSRLEEFVKQTNKVPTQAGEFWMGQCVKVVLLVVRCPKCGAAKVFRHSN